MSRAAKWISAILFLVLLGLLGVYAALRLPYSRARSEMPRGTALLLSEQDDGTLLAAWEASPSADDYALRVFAHTPDAQGERACLFSAVCAQTQCVLPAELPEDQPVDVMICARRHYSALGEERIRMGDDPVCVACYLNRPKIENLTATVDADSAVAYLSWTGWQGDAYRPSILALWEGLFHGEP